VLEGAVTTLDRDYIALADLGLTLSQSRVYITLLRLGTARAGSLSYVMGVARPEAYRILGELSTKGLVQRNLGSPTTYTATPPDRAVSILVQAVREKLQTMEQMSASIVRNLSAVTPVLNSPTTHTVGLLTGGSNVILKIIQMLTDAKLDYAGISSSYALKILPETRVLKALMNAKRRRLSIRLISEINDSNRTSADIVSKYVELRQTKDVLFFMDIVDCKEMVLGAALSGAEARDFIERAKKVDLCTTDLRFIKGMYAIFEHLWEISPTYDKLR
jgi:sugar-specific transcriptional regulator TrmB